MWRATQFQSQSLSSVSLLCNHILVLHAGCTIVVTRKIITQFKSIVCTEDKKGRKVGRE